MRQAKTRTAFSLVELIVVVVIIGILAAIAIPRFSRGATGAGGSGVKGNLSVLRNAIEMYYYEHGEYPGKLSAGASAAAGTEAAFVAQLTKYTDDDGDATDTPDSTHRYGPYLRAASRPARFRRAGKTGIKMLNSGTPAFDNSSADAGWVFNYETGDIVVNSDAPDPDGVEYDKY